MFSHFADDYFVRHLRIDPNITKDLKECGIVLVPSSQKCNVCRMGEIQDFYKEMIKT